MAEKRGNKMEKNAINVVDVTDVFVKKAVSDMVEMQTELGQRGLALPEGVMRLVCRKLARSVTGVICDVIKVK